MTDPRENDGSHDCDDDENDWDGVYPDDYDEWNEPVGSCEQCGTNLYEEDDEEYCDQCLWRLSGGPSPC